MPTVHEHFSEQFQQWERRGRGWQMFAHPVRPEPPFVPFTLRSTVAARPVDDGHRPTFLSAMVQRLSRSLAAKPPVSSVEPEAEEPVAFTRESLVEFQASLPDKLDVSRDTFEQFLVNLSLCREPIAFELLGTHKKVTTQFAASAADAPLLRRQLAAFFPAAVFDC